VILSSLVAAVTASCGGGSSNTTRQVLVDFNNPGFAGIFVGYFPTSVTVHPGMTLHFKQAWNGEPHSVTMGTLVDKALPIVNPLLPQLNGEGRPPPDVQAKAEAAFANLPFMVDNNNNVVQSAAEPCFLDRGVPSQDPRQACPKRPQPAFNGRQPYYSSGFISYAGNNGNSYDVKLSNDIRPGTYHWYCDFHGPQMQGTVVVKPTGTSIPSQGSVDSRALTAATAKAAPLAKALKAATTGPWDIFRAAEIAGFPSPPPAARPALAGDFFAGYATQNFNSVLVNEFLPATIRAKVGQKLTWLFVGDVHTVSFDVPSYFPLLKTTPAGVVEFDPRAQNPVGGAGLPVSVPDGAPNPYIVDGGTWNGAGFRSSGLSPQTQSNQIVGWSLTITKAGTYQYACLIHPRMVATVIVSK
jgi:plastocyanin